MDRGDHEPHDVGALLVPLQAGLVDVVKGARRAVVGGQAIRNDDVFRATCLFDVIVLET